jgi:hypothetical protein
MKFDLGFGAAFVLFILITSASTAVVRIFGPTPDCPTPIESSK